jgi:hypothetical protein
MMGKLNIDRSMTGKKELYNEKDNFLFFDPNASHRQVEMLKHRLQ